MDERISNVKKMEDNIKRKKKQTPCLYIITKKKKMGS